MMSIFNRINPDGFLFLSGFKYEFTILPWHNRIMRFCIHSKIKWNLVECTALAFSKPMLAILTSERNGINMVCKMRHDF